MEKKRILIVDDDKVLLKSFKEIFETEGYTVDTAETGKEAVEKSNANFYNLAFLDIRLPDMEGTELLTRMKETRPKMVKIMVTGYPSQENAIEAVNRGAHGYVVKPIVNIDDLIAKVKEHLKKQEEEEIYSEEKVTQFIETRARKLEDKPTI